MKISAISLFLIKVDIFYLTVFSFYFIIFDYPQIIISFHVSCNLVHGITTLPSVLISTHAFKQRNLNFGKSSFWCCWSL